MGFGYSSTKSVEMDDQNNTDKSIGVIEVCIHQARDIHNICIYQNQDVYAKFCLTDNPENKTSSQVINGGGKNPVFNENLRLSVQKMDSSLRCEVWMLSRIKNYLEDQLLGFAMVPLSDVVSESGKPAREFELSSSELFHSPAGFVELSFKNFGTSPEVMVISDVANVDEKVDDVNKVSCELDRIEFPDQETANENEKMVSQYLNFPCDEWGVERGSCSLENGNNMSEKTEVHLLEKAGADQGEANDVIQTTTMVSTTAEPIIDIGVEHQGEVVQEEIVDMYMKGMQQFTDALAKMKLPMDIGDGSIVEKGNDKREDAGTRVFYGSRAFF